MTFQTMSARKLMLAAALAAVSTAASADWAQSPNPLVVAPAPKNLSTQVANPPVFSWARHSSNPDSYTVEIRANGAVYKTFNVKRNWLFPTTPFAKGTYTWRVRPSTSSTAWSDPRTFIIDSNARDFIVYDDNFLRNRIAGKARPRSIQSNIPVYSNWSAAMKAERGAALQRLRTEVEWSIPRLAFPKDSDWPLRDTNVQTAANAAQNAAVRSAVFGNGRQLSAAALLYRLTGEQKYLTEALARADALVALDINGPTSYQNQDQGTRVIALSLAKAFDLISGNIDATRRNQWLWNIDQRTTAIYNDLSGSSGRMDQYPFDSHGGTNLAYLALIAALSVGNIPNANQWFDFSFRASVASTSVWSGPDGGFGNGTAYAQYAAESILAVWQPLGVIAGVNLFDKPWTRGFMNYLMQFLPPGSMRHVFGDEHEVTPSMRVMKGFAARYATPQTAWYFHTISNEMDALTMLEAPYPLPVATINATTPPSNSAIFPSIGWSAMHSNMADANRTSVFFKSSPYGSFNHSHADQNSFVVMKGGHALLSEAGYSDYYSSPMANSWYRQTKAHNGITFDNGQGQITTGYTPEGYNKQMIYGGRLTAFSPSSSVDFVEGDATPTYDGALSKAVRKLWYLRQQDAVVILDTLAAPVARKFEWNVHSLAAMSFESSTKTINVTNANGTHRACVRPIPSAPDYNLERRTGVAPKAGTVEDHAAYVSSAARTSQEFMILIDIGCKRPDVSLTASDGGRTLKVGAQTIILPR